MDPYLERSWGDVHTHLITQTASQLNRELPPDLVARVEERICIESDEDVEQHVRADVGVIEVEVPGDVLPAGLVESGMAVAEPIRLRVSIEPATERHINILESDSERLVTVFEYLSPTNKRRGMGMSRYLTKRRRLLEAGVNVVEVDLLRTGEWRELLFPHLSAPDKHGTAYRVVIRTAADRDEVLLYPISIRQKLPSVLIPLRPTDRAISLDLQSFVEQVYQSGRYDRTNYTNPCQPPLDRSDTAWVEELLRVNGRR